MVWKEKMQSNEYIDQNKKNIKFCCFLVNMKKKQITYHIKELFKRSRVVYRLSWGNIRKMEEIVIKGQE